MMEHKGYKPRHVHPDIRRPAAEIFATLFQVYLTASNDIKKVIESMSKIVNDPAADEDERNAALDTLVEALFKPRPRFARPRNLFASSDVS